MDFCIRDHYYNEVSHLPLIADPKYLKMMMMTMIRRTLNQERTVVVLKMVQVTQK